MFKTLTPSPSGSNHTGQMSKNTSQDCNLPIPPITVDTLYDPDLPNNIQVPFAGQDRTEWTERERALAADADVITSPEELITKLGDMYPAGSKTQSKPYIRIPSSSFPQ